MNAKWITLHKDLAANQVRPVYLLAGEEIFQIEEAITAIRRAIFGDRPQNTEFLLELFDGEGLDSSAFLSAIQRLPGLFDDADSRRLVICRRFDKAPAAAVEGLITYLGDPNPTTTLVLSVSKMDKRKAWVKAIEEKGWVLEVHEPFDRDWPKWQTYVERKIHKRFEPGAWDALVDSAGRTLATVWTEAGKLGAYTGSAASITAADVRATAGTSSETDIFGFCEDVANRDWVEAHCKYRSLVASGESEIKLLALLVRLFRQVRQCRALLDQGITDSRALASEVGVPPFAISKRITQAKSMTLPQADSILKRLAEADYRLKVGKGSLFDNFLAATL